MEKVGVQKRRSDLPLILIFGGVGIVLLVVTGLIYNARQEFIGEALSAEGVIIGFEKRAASTSSVAQRRYVYAPIVRFTDKDNRQITFTAQAAGSGSNLKKEDSVEVFYSKTDSNDAKIATFFHLWAAPVVVGILGSVFFGIGLILCVVAWRERSSSAKESGLS